MSKNVARSPAACVPSAAEASKRVQALPGHAPITMTFDVYGHQFRAPEDDHARFKAGELAPVSG